MNTIADFLKFHSAIQFYNRLMSSGTLQKIPKHVSNCINCVKI